MLSVYFTPDLPEGQAKAGEASQFASFKDSSILAPFLKKYLSWEMSITGLKQYNMSTLLY